MPGDDFGQQRREHLLNQRRLDLEGVEGPAEVALVGTAEEVRSSIESMGEHGVTEFVAVEFSADRSALTSARARAAIRHRRAPAGTRSPSTWSQSIVAAAASVA